MDFGIRINRLRKSYWSRSQDGWQSQIALDLEDIFIPFGKITAILGRSGSGKSTLLSILGLVMPPDSLRRNGINSDISSITFNFPFPLTATDESTNFDLQELWKNQAIREILLRKYFGFVFQDSLLFPGLSIKQNIKLPTLLNGVSTNIFDALWAQSLNSGLFEELYKGGQRDENREDADRGEDALSLFQKLKRSLRHHHGEATPDKYSGGQLQRFALIRSVLHDPRVIFADEPTGNLDPSTADKVFAFLQSWQRHSSQRTLVLVTHDVQLARQYADRILIIDDKHGIKTSAVFDAVEKETSKKPRSKWKASLEQMTSLLSDDLKPVQKGNQEEIPIFPKFDSKVDRSLASNGNAVTPKVKFAWSFSRWDIWPKTPNLKWTTIVGLFITSILSVTSFLILGFYKGSSKYLEIIQSNPFIRSLNVSRPLTDAAIDQFTLSQVARISAKSEDPESFYLGDSSADSEEKVLSYVSGFNRRSLWGSLLDPEAAEAEPIRLRGRTIDPDDPVLKIVEENLITGRSFNSDRDIGLIVSKSAVARLGTGKSAASNSPKVLYSQYGSGIESRIRRFPIIGIADRLPEPGGDFLMTNYFYAQLVNHYFAPTSLSSFELGTFPDMIEAEKVLRELRPHLDPIGLRGSSYKAPDGFNLKFTYRDGRQEHEDIVIEHYRQLIKKIDKSKASSIDLLPFHRMEKSVSVQDTTLFSYGSLYINDFKFAKGLQEFLQAQFKVDMNLGMIESLDTINSMKDIITGIVIGMLICLGFTGIFVVYSVFSQFASRSSKQFGVLKTMGIDKKNLGLVHSFEVLIIFGISAFVGITGSIFLGSLLDKQLQAFLSTTQQNHQFFEISFWQVFVLLLMMLLTYIVAAALAVKKVYAKSAIELMKDQRNFSPRWSAAYDAAGLQGKKKAKDRSM